MLGPIKQVADGKESGDKARAVGRLGLVDPKQVARTRENRLCIDEGSQAFVSTH